MGGGDSDETFRILYQEITLKIAEGHLNGPDCGLFGGYRRSQSRGGAVKRAAGPMLLSHFDSPCVGSKENLGGL